jgi:NADH-quinone oxidoreductase subunit A
VQGEAAKKLAWVAFADIVVFFGVLLVGFAYLWRRGDLEWVRSLAAQGGEGASANEIAGQAQSSPPTAVGGRVEVTSGAS